MRDATSYRIIAPFYDWIMSHVDYDAWGAFIRKVWKKQGLHPQSILELSAGTCPFRVRKAFAKYPRIVYTDLSPYMLKHSFHSIEGEAINKDRVAVNSLALPFKSQFDACLMIYDSLNYLMEEGDVKKCFKEVFQVLKPGGIFIFDMTTETNSLRYFQHMLAFEEMEGCSFARQSWYDKDVRVQHNEFIFFVKTENGQFLRYEENHTQRIYRLAEIENWIKQCGFNLVDCYSNFRCQPAKENSERIHLILKKP